MTEANRRQDGAAYIQRPGAALVTGGGTRLGSHFALNLASRGYDIALHYNTSREPALRVAERVRAMSRRCELFELDFNMDRDPGHLVSEVATAMPGLNLLVNSASAYDAVATADTDRAMLEKQFGVNFFAPYLLTRRFATDVKAGSVINILDNKIAYQQYHYSAYLLSKKTLAEFTKMAALEFAPAIRINGIAPGVVLPMGSRTSEYLDWRIDGIPLKRQGLPEELCQAMNYLLDNPFVCGQILFVDGGEAINHVGRNSETFPGSR